jgi:FtsP/CotA-like multicopper oxidase with cupredoxin domain
MVGAAGALAQSEPKNPSLPQASLPKVALPVAMANDNRTAAGELKNNILELKLEMQEAIWYAEEEGGGHRDAFVFAESGRAPQTPGPLIRVAQGTEIHASIRNMLPLAAKIYGLHQHPGDAKDSLSVAAGETREVRFVAGEPGTYLYWGTTANHSLENRDQAESLLDGAFIVDAPGAKVDDRVFVLGIWKKGNVPGDGEEIAGINGKAWPHGERVTYTAGDTIHWRVIDPTFSPHGMHMHGFYFTVDGVGDGESYTQYPAEQRRAVVTELIDVGHTFELTWKPERSGNWLFHCHMVSHMSPSEALHPPSAKPVSDTDHDHNMLMAGLVVGITILPKADAKPAVVSAGAARKLQLVISDNAGKIPLYKLEVKDPTHPAAPMPAGTETAPSFLGPPIVLTRGEATEIEIKNQMKEPTAIHWHGMELESYYDGVVGWTGSGKQTTPPIAAGGSFVARMLPVRAGTFIYHTHWHDVEQLLNGVYGPLIVLEPGEKYDTSHDRTFVFSSGKYAPFGYLMLINGVPEPERVELHSGERYRLRMINITDDIVDMRVRLTSNDNAVQWKIIAKDGANLPAVQVKFSAADMPITVGETYDVEYEAKDAGEASLQIWEVSYPTLVTVPLRFSAAAGASGVH